MSVENSNGEVEIQPDSRPAEVCQYLVSQWLVQEGCIDPSRIPNVKGIVVMAPGEDEGVDIRLTILRAPLSFLDGTSRYAVNRRVGTSDKAITKEKLSVTAEGIKNSTRPDRTHPVDADKFIEHLEEVVNHPLRAIDVYLHYPADPAEMPDLKAE